MIDIPKIKDLYDGVLADLEASVDITIPLFGKVFLRGLAAVQAAKLKTLYLVAAILQRNIFPDTAQPENVGGTLERFGRVKLGRNPFSAVPGEYTVSLTGTTGGIVPEGQVFKSDDDSLNPGFLFILDEEYEMPGSSGSITLRALTPGTESKLEVGNKLTATSPIAEVDSQVTVTVEAVAPSAEEGIEDYRTKVLNSFRIEAQGGASADYRLWSQDAQGVKNTYIFAKSGEVNAVNVYVEATVEDSTDEHGTPTPTILTEVEEVIERSPDTTLPLLDRGRRPTNVIVNVLPVEPLSVEIQILGYVGLNATIESLILSSIEELINSIRPYVAAIDAVDDKNDILDVNRVIAAILSARPGSTFTSVVLTVDGVDLSTYTFENGYIPYLDTVTYP